MTISRKTRNQSPFRVVHPLDDLPEAKLATRGLMPMQLSRAGRAALVLLRIYLSLMTILLIGYILHAGMVWHHHS